MAEIHGLLGGVVGLVFGLVAARIAGQWVMGPLEHAACERDYPVQFTVADILCLFLAMQLMLGTFYWNPSGSLYERALVTILAFAVVGGAWWGLVRMLSRAGVRVVWQRCLLMLIVVPITVIGASAVAFAPFAAIDLFMPNHMVLWDVAILSAAVALPAPIYRLGRFTRAIVASAAKQ